MKRKDLASTYSGILLETIIRYSQTRSTTVREGVELVILLKTPALVRHPSHALILGEKSHSLGSQNTAHVCLFFIWMDFVVASFTVRAHKYNVCHKLL